MDVHFMCAYYSQWAHSNLAPRTQAQWDAFKFCRAVKNRRINGSLTFPWKNGPEIINQETVFRARWIFGLFLQDRLKLLNLRNPVLVPIPSKDGLVNAASFRSLEMLKEAVTAQKLVARVEPILRFSEPLIAAHAGGPRGREAIRPFLRLIALPSGGPVVLIDDIITTGGTLLAAYDVMSEAGHAPHCAIVCGHTVSDSLLSAFGGHKKTIDTSPQEIDF